MRFWVVLSFRGGPGGYLTNRYLTNSPLLLPSIATVEDHAKPSNDKDSIPGHLRSKAWERNSSGGFFTASLTPSVFNILNILNIIFQYRQQNLQLRYTENIEKDFSIPNTALLGI